MAIEVSKKLFTVHDYYRMADAGILREDDRMELIHGEILLRSPGSPRHDAAVLRANQSLARTVGGRALVGVHGPVRLDDFDEPQPDLYLLRPKADFYASGHAGPSDIFLIIEVTDSSLEYDETIKLQLYAATGVPGYWISDIQNDRIVAYSELLGNTYSVRREFHRGETIAPKLLPDCPIPVDSLLP